MLFCILSFPLIVLTCNGARRFRLKHSAVGSDTVLLGSGGLNLEDDLLVGRVPQVQRRGHNFIERA